MGVAVLLVPPNAVDDDPRDLQVGKRQVGLLVPTFRDVVVTAGLRESPQRKFAR